MDTTNALISFALYLMALNVDIQDKVRTEIDTVLKTDGLEETITYDNIIRLEYLDQFIAGMYLCY